MSSLRSLPAPPTRLSAKLSRAIDLRVRKGVPIAEACKEAGLSSAGWYKAMKRAAVRDHMDEVQRRFIGEVDLQRAVARGRAIEVGLELMANAQSETVRARMVEFFLSEGKTPQVAVHVDARSMPPPVGYAYPSFRVNAEAATGPDLIEGDPATAPAADKGMEA